MSRYINKIELNPEQVAHSSRSMTEGQALYIVPSIPSWSSIGVSCHGWVDDKCVVGGDPGVNTKSVLFAFSLSSVSE